MNRSDIRETIKMHLSMVDEALPYKYSDSFLDKLIEKEHRNVCVEARVIRKFKEDVVATDITTLVTEADETLITESGETLIADGFDTYIDLGTIDDFYKMRSISDDGNKIRYFKYDNQENLGSIESYTDETFWYEAAGYILFINGGNKTFTLYYYAKPQAITSDTQILELDEQFEDAVVYGVLRRIAISTRGLNYEIVLNEYKNELAKAKNYYRKKYIDDVGVLVGADF